MKQITTTYLGVATAFLLGGFQASAVIPVNESGHDGTNTGLHYQLQGLGAPYSSIDVHADQLTPGLTWTSVGSSVGAELLVEVAGWAGINTFGIYNAANPLQFQQVFSGPDGGGATASFTPLYSEFGFYLKNDSYTWYSDPSLNGGAHHVVSYALGGNSYLFGWEDLSSSNWDWDYQDFVVQVSNVRPVPDAASTMALFGLGVTAVGFLRRRK